MVDLHVLLHEIATSAGPTARPSISAQIACPGRRIERGRELRLLLFPRVDHVPAVSARVSGCQLDRIAQPSQEPSTFRLAE